MRRFSFLILFVLTVQTASAQVGKPTTFSFLRLEPSASSASLAGSVAASTSEDVPSFLYNPSSLSADMSGHVSLSYLNHLADVTSGLAAYVHNSNTLETTFAGAIRYMSYGSVQRTDEFGIESGEFNPSSLAMTISASRQYDESIGYGASVHYIYSGIDSYSASAVALDAGVQYVAPESGFSAGAAISNAGVVLGSLGTTSDELPLDLRIGVAKQLTHLPLMLTATLFNLTDFDKTNEDASRLDDVLHHVVIGGEFQFGSSFRARFGYNHRRHDELKTKSRLDFSGFSMGAGIEVRKVRIDYARSSWSENGSLNQFTVTTRVR